MRRLPLILICLAACSGPTRKTEQLKQYDSFASVSPVSETVTVKTETRTAASLELFREIDRMAARVDMLWLQMSDPQAFSDVEDPVLQRRASLRQLAAFDLRLMEFEDSHAQLDPGSTERYERLVREPFRELQDRVQE